MKRAAIIVLASCSFTPKPGPATDGGPGGPGAPSVTVVDDSAAMLDGSTTGGGTTTRGTIEPDVYMPGGLHARGYLDPQHTVLQDGNYAALEASLGAAGSATGEDYGFLPFDDYPQNPTAGQVDRPRGLHLPTADHFAVLLDGEIFLPAGTTTLALDVDDSAFFDIMTPAGVQRIQANVSTVTQAITVDADGWYPIDGAFGENDNSARLALALLDARGSATSLLASHLRTRTTDVRGLADGGYYLPELELGPYVGWASGGLGSGLGSGQGSDFTADLADLGLGSACSARFTGQLLVDADGDYVAAPSVGSAATEGFRLYLDGALVADRWLTLATVAPSAPIHLAAGWHTITLDLAHATGPAQLGLALGPTADALAPVAADHLRPTRAFGATALAVGSGNVSYSGGTPATATLTVVPPPSAGQIIDTIDEIYVLPGARDPGQTLTIAQNGTSSPLAIHPTANETEQTTPYDYLASDAHFTGQPIAPTWSLTFTDSTPGASGAITGFAIVSYHGGGPATPFAPALVYTSPPRETPGAVALRRLHVDGALAGIAPTLAVRLAADDAGLTAAPWTLVTDGDLDLAGPFGALQYRVELDTDGWAFPSIDKITFAYDTAPR